MTVIPHDAEHPLDELDVDELPAVIEVQPGHRVGQGMHQCLDARHDVAVGPVFHRTIRGPAGEHVGEGDRVREFALEAVPAVGDGIDFEEPGGVFHRGARPADGDLGAQHRPGFCRGQGGRGVVCVAHRLEVAVHRGCGHGQQLVADLVGEQGGVGFQLAEAFEAFEFIGDDRREVFAAGISGQGPDPGQEGDGGRFVGAGPALG